MRNAAYYTIGNRLWKKLLKLLLIVILKAKSRLDFKLISFI